MTLQGDNKFKVLRFNPENLALALSNEFTGEEEIRNKFHYHYFLQYFENIKNGPAVQTILIETKHISLSYLKDYSYYFASTFQQYSSFCKRVHFFSTEFTQDDLLEMIQNASPKAESVWDSYAGYTIVKPLPNAKLGSTVLKIQQQQSVFSTIRDYPVYLLGKKIIIQSLAFQEQDGIVSRCATIAIWTSLHKNAHQFFTALPAPVEITLAAQYAFSEGRLMPNEGLDKNQICKAFETFGVVTELRADWKLKNPLMIKRFIYAYLKNGFPVLVGLKTKDEQKREQNHIITFVGFKDLIDDADARIEEENGQLTHPANVDEIHPIYRADYINEYYAHDDQSGPFSTVSFVNKNKQLRISRKAFNEKFKMRDEFSQVTTIIVAISHMIKIAFDDVAEEVYHLDFAFKELKFSINFQWDIYLSSTQDYHQSIRNQEEYSDHLKAYLLTTFLPQYIWVARMVVEEDVLMEFVFDATALKISNKICLLAYPVYEEEVTSFIQQSLKIHDPETLKIIFQNTHYIDLLKNSINHLEGIQH